MLDKIIEELKKRGYDISVKREKGRYTLSLSFKDVKTQIEVVRKVDIINLLYFLFLRELEYERKNR